MFSHQKEALRTKQRFAVWVWHRKARKTTTSLEKLNLEAHLKKGVYWYVSPSRPLAHETIWKDPNMLQRIVRPELLDHKNEMDLAYYYKCGSVLSVIGADRPDLIRGPNPSGVVLDEFSVMKPSVWEAIIQPIMRANTDAWCWFLFTPKGKNHAHKVFQYGEQGLREWKSWLLPASKSGVFDPEQLEDAKRTMSHSLYMQEFECDFLESESTVFRNVREIATASPLAPLADHLYVIGVDVAKVQDFTVLAVYDRATNREVYQDRFQTLEWPFQKKRIKEIAKHYNNALVVIDATGVGDPIADDLLREGIAVEPFKITSETKKEIIEKLSIWIDQQKIKILPIETTINELENFGYEISESGRISYGGREGFNDDTVIAHALAVWSLTPLYKETPEEELTPIQQSLRKAVKEYEGETDEIPESEWKEYEES